MGFMDSMKNAAEGAAKKTKQKKDEYDAKQKKLNEERGKKLARVTVEYTGGYEEVKKGTGSLYFYEKRVEFDALSKSKKFVINRDQVARVAVEGRDQAAKRVTVTRLLAIGIFAFAAKKTTDSKEAFLTIEMNDGSEVVFWKDKTSPLDLKKKLTSVVSLYKSNETASASSGSLNDLEKLAELKDKGVISQEDFDAKKKEILGL